MKHLLSLVLLAGISSLLSCSETSSVSGSPPDNRLTVSERFGTAPLQVLYTLSFTESSDYTIKRILWDMDRNGTADSVTTLGKAAIEADDSYELSMAYLNLGAYSPKVTIVYNENDAESFAYLNSEYIEIPGRGRVITDSVYVLEPGQ